MGHLVITTHAIVGMVTVIRDGGITLLGIGRNTPMKDVKMLGAAILTMEERDEWRAAIGEPCVASFAYDVGADFTGLWCDEMTPKRLRVPVEECAWTSTTSGTEPIRRPASA